MAMGVPPKVAVITELGVKPLPDTVVSVPARPNAGKIEIDDRDALPKAQR